MNRLGDVTISDLVGATVALAWLLPLLRSAKTTVLLNPSVNWAVAKGLADRESAVARHRPVIIAVPVDRSGLRRASPKVIAIVVFADTAPVVLGSDGQRNVL